MKICVLPGDGIGPEIMAQAVRVLNALDLPFEMEEALVGGCAVDATGNPLPEATLELARAADAILLGAVGGPKWDSHPRNQRPELGLLGIRKELALFANLRPAILYPELANASTLKPEIVAGLDILIVRELTGDIYFGQPRGIELREVNGETQRVGWNTMIYAEYEIRRILKVAFEAAQKRGGLRGRCGRYLFFLELGEHEGIHGIEPPIARGDRGFDRFHDGTVGPLPARGGVVDLPFADAARDGLVARIGSTHRHPLLEHGDLLRRHLRLRRHLEILVAVADRMDQQAGVGISRDDGRPAVSARFPARLAV